MGGWIGVRALNNGLQNPECMCSPARGLGPVIHVLYSLQGIGPDIVDDPESSSDWTLIINENTDSYGWQYANRDQINPFGTEYHPKECRNDILRRRHWVWSARLLSAGSNVLLRLRLAVGWDLDPTIHRISCAQSCILQHNLSPKRALLCHQHCIVANEGQPGTR